MHILKPEYSNICKANGNVLVIHQKITKTQMTTLLTQNILPSSKLYIRKAILKLTVNCKNEGASNLYRESCVLDPTQVYWWPYLRAKLHVLTSISQLPFKFSVFPITNIEVWPYVKELILFSC